MADVPRDFWSYHKAYLKYDAIGPFCLGGIFVVWAGVASILLGRVEQLPFAFVIGVGLSVALSTVFVVLREVRRLLSFTGVEALSPDRFMQPKGQWFERSIPIVVGAVMLFVASNQCVALNWKAGYFFWQGRRNSFQENSKQRQGVLTGSSRSLRTTPTAIAGVPKRINCWARLTPRESTACFCCNSRRVTGKAIPERWNSSTGGTTTSSTN